MKKKLFFLTMLAVFGLGLMSVDAYTPKRGGMQDTESTARAGIKRGAVNNSARRARVRLGLPTGTARTSTVVSVGSTGGATITNNEPTITGDDPEEPKLGLYECAQKYTSCLEKPGICGFGLRECKKYLLSTMDTNMTAESITPAGVEGTYIVQTLASHKLYEGLDIRMTEPTSGDTVVAKVESVQSIYQFTVRPTQEGKEFESYVNISLTTSSILSQPGFANEKGRYCDEVLTQCEDTITTADIYPYLIQQMENRFYITDYATCRDEYMRCAKGPTVCNVDYTGCVDFLVTDVRNVDSAAGIHSCIINKLDCEIDKMTACYDRCETLNVNELTTQVECIQKCQENKDDYALVCKTGYQACLQSQGSSTYGYYQLYGEEGEDSYLDAFENRVAGCNEEVFSRCQITETEKAQIESYLQEDYLRNVDEALIRYNEIHGKAKWNQALDCVDKVDECMKEYCGEDYKKCLTQTGQPDDKTLNNFRSFCQKDLISCSELRVSAGMKGYQFLLNPQVDGVEQVWEDFVNNKMLAYGAAREVERRELERELEVLIARAQKRCQDDGGTFTYEQKQLDVYATRYGDKSETKADKSGGSVLYGANTSAEKSQNFYEKAVCKFEVDMKGKERAKDKIRSKKTLRDFEYGDTFKCDAATFKVKGPQKKNAGGKGALIGGSLGAIGGAIAGGNLSTRAEGKIKDIGIGAGVGAATGVGIGAAIGAVTTKSYKKQKEWWSCFMGDKQVAKYEASYTFPMPQEFIDLENFYQLNPDLVVQRGEFNASGTSILQ